MAALDNIQAIAHQEIMKTIPDTLIRKNALYNRLIKRYKPLKGGTEVIQIPIFVTENASQGFINPAGGTFDINPNENLTYGTLNYKTYQCTSTITQKDLNATEDSENAIIAMTKLKVSIAFNSMIRELSAAVYASGTTANLGFNGFADIFAASGTAYAGINDTTYASWLPVYDSSTTIVSYTAIANMLATLAERVDEAPVAPDLESSYGLDLMLSKARVQAAFKSTLQTQQRFMDDDLVKAGFKGIEVDGIPWVVDYYAPGTASTSDNYLYILSTASFNFGIRFGFGKGPESMISGKHILPNQPISTKTSMNVGNFWCENRRVNGAFKTLNA